MGPVESFGRVVGLRPFLADGFTLRGQILYHGWAKGYGGFRYRDEEWETTCPAGICTCCI